MINLRLFVVELFYFQFPFADQTKCSNIFTILSRPFNEKRLKSKSLFLFSTLRISTGVQDSYVKILSIVISFHLIIILVQYNSSCFFLTFFCYFFIYLSLPVSHIRQCVYHNKTFLWMILGSKLTKCFYNYVQLIVDKVFFKCYMIILQYSNIHKLTKHSESFTCRNTNDVKILTVEIQLEEGRYKIIQVMQLAISVMF